MRHHVDQSTTAQRQIRQLLEWLQGRGHHAIPTATVVSARNRTHGPTSTGRRSDHQGPRNYAWAADLPAGSLLEGDALADDVAQFLRLARWPGRGVYDETHVRYRYQLIWGTADHSDHVHIGVRRLGPLPSVQPAYR
jgi:hypothetical protein